MMEVRLYLLQRISAMVMVPLVIGHIAVMIYAIQDGLTAEEILGRTQGSVAWALFYGTFVVAVAIHGAIGLRAIVSEWLGVRGMALTGFAWATFWGLLAMGLYAVAAVIGGPA
ncbi:MAG: succinate dehydrogenase [Pseudomonadota bacterium]